MNSDALDLEGESGSPFAAGHDRIIHESGLAIKSGNGAPRFLHKYVRSIRIGMGDFFVPRQNHFQRSSVISSGVQRFDRIQKGYNAALHIERPRSVSRPFLDCKRPFGSCPDRKHRIHMPHEHYSRLGTIGADFTNEHVAGFFHLHNPCAGAFTVEDLLETEGNSINSGLVP